MGRAVREVDEKFAGLGEVHRLMRKAFPREERIPFPLLLLRQKLGDLEVLAYYDGSRLCGMSVTCSDSAVCSLMYLAVPERMRGRGVGSSILRYLRKRHKGKVFCADIEVPYANAENAEQRLKRLRFYEKNGLMSTHTGYTCRDVDYLVVADNGVFNEPLFRAIYDRMFFGLFSPEFVEF